MVDSQIIEDRKKDRKTLDEVTTLIWNRETGARLATIRMKMLMDQKQLARALGVNQQMVSRLELGHAAVCEKITVSGLKTFLGNHFSFLVLGSNAERYQAATIAKVYWDTRLRVGRKNKSVYSKGRLL